MSSKTIRRRRYQELDKASSDGRSEAWRLGCGVVGLLDELPSMGNLFDPE